MFEIDFCSDENFHRLEEFTSYTSCIKCFGRAIIPPLLTSRQKEEIDAFRATAVRKEADLSRRRTEKSLSNIHNAVGAFTPIKEECFILCQKNNDPPNFFSTQNNETSALCSSNVIGFQSSSSMGTSFTAKEMHMSMSKIPSNGICSTVHKEVIVSTNIHNENKSYSAVSCGNVNEGSNALAIKEFCPHLASPECYLCQVDCHPYSFTNPGVPYEDLSNEQMTSVSEVEASSGTEEIEFESLPTVICARKSTSHDTDNESSITCITQSTDLDKYMDCSIEFSSPDQSNISKLQASSQLTISSRSDDASSETLVNTESELTPCASAMAELNNYNDDAGVKLNVPSSKDSSDIHQRALSVDSYMKVLKTCARNLFIRKSRSEPSHSEGSSASCGNRLDSADLPSECIKDTMLKAGFEVSDFQPIEYLSPTKPILKDSDDKGLNPSEIKTPKKRHIRKNSYTLDQPSSALIKAHADCNCRYDPTTVSPHSCSLGTKSAIPNPAFMKEKIDRVFALTPDQYKYLPILNSSSCSARNVNHGLEKSIPSLESSLLTDAGCSGSTLVTKNDGEVNVESGECSNSDKLVNSMQYYEMEIQQDEPRSLVKSSPVDSTKNESEVLLINCEVSSQQNEQMSVTSPVDLSDVKSDEIKICIAKNLCEARERQRIRVKQLFEEQDRQWLKLQQEFKDEERLLSEKFHYIEMPSLSNNVPKTSMLSSNVSSRNCDVDDNVSSNIKSETILHAASAIAEEKNCTANESESLNEVRMNETKENNSDEPSNVETSPESHASMRNSSNSDRSSHFTSLSRLSSLSNITPSSVAVSTARDFSRNNDANNLEQLTVMADNTLRCSNSHNRSNSVEPSIRLHPVSDANDQMEVYSVSAPNTRSNSRQFISVNSAISSAGSCKVDSFRNPNNGYKTVQICESSKAENAIKSAFNNFPSIDLHNMSNILSSDIVLESPPNRENDYNVAYSLSDDVHSHTPTLSSSSRFICSPQEKCFTPDTVHDHDNVFMGQANTYQGDISKEHKPGGSFINKCQIQNYIDNSEKNISENFQRNMPAHPTGLKNVPFDSFPMQYPYHENNMTSMIDSVLLLPGCGLSDSSKTATCLSNDVNKAFVNRASQLACPLQNTIPENVGNFSTVRSSANCSNTRMMKEDSDFAISTSNFISQTCQSNELSKSSSVSAQTSRTNSSSSHRTDNVLSSSPVRALKQATSASMTNLRRKYIKNFAKDHIALGKLNNKPCSFEKLPAFVKGYLTRRLFKTERVQGLIKTLQDTVIVTIRVSEELTLKGDSVSENDVHFYQQLMVQLMGTYRSVYDIFSTISTKERMQIIAESRKLRLKKREVGETEYPHVVVDISAESMTTEKPKLSAATIKTLERKRRPNIENRTYTIKDFKSSSPRKPLSTSSKSRPSSPSCIYKSAGLTMKRKSTSVCKTRPWK